MPLSLAMPADVIWKDALEQLVRARCLRAFCDLLLSDENYAALHPSIRAVVDAQDVAADNTVGRVRSDQWWHELERIVIELYPTGPQEAEIWSRGGQNLSALHLHQNGRASWHRAIRLLKNGAGQVEGLLLAMHDDFPSHSGLRALVGRE